MLCGKRFCSVSSCIATTTLLAVAPSCWATIKTGGFRITPFIEFNAINDTNIYLAPDAPVSSLITTVNPGVYLSFFPRKSEYTLDLRSEFVFYSEAPSVNNAVNNTAVLHARTVFPCGLSVTVDDTYRGTADPATSELTRRVARNENTVTPRIACRFSRFVTGTLVYSQTLHDYIPAGYKAAYNRRESDAYLEAACNVSPRTFILLDYGVGGIDYSYRENPNSSRHVFLLAGVRGQLTPKTQGEAKFGAKERTYRQRSVPPVALTVLSLSTVTRFSEKTRLDLAAGRNFVESTYDANFYYVANALAFSLDRKVFGSWNVTLRANYEINDYPDATMIDGASRKRHDSIALGGLAVYYTGIRARVAAGGGCYLRSRFSNFDAFCYRDAVTSLSLRILF